INPSLSQISLSSSHPIIDKRGTGTSEAINGSEGYEFTLDSIYNPYSTTQDLYEGNVQKVIKSCVRDGYNVTVFAYGQTGSGKTFTMMGSDQDVENKGIVPRSIDEVFQVISQEDQNREYLLRISYLEIYNETLKDLLSDGTPQKLTIHENQKGRVYVNGLREEVVTHPLQVITTLQKGEKARHVGATDWNERSSRSHTVFTMTIESRPRDSEELIQTGIQISQLNLIDLAGSESAASSIERRKEGSFINKSLLSLSNVISKLATSEPHVPYRDSKLTRLLQTSLGGNAKVVVICAVSVNNDSVGETLSTLRFARRAKMVITKAERGTILDDKSALLQSYQQEIISLKAQL
ncbi:kinesin motor domain-containing protein, partial [Melampsora americana]